MDDFCFLSEKAIFEKNTKAIVHGFVKKRVSALEMESNHFVLGCTSIRPETA